MLKRATLTVREAAHVLGVSPDSIYEAARRGEIPVLRIGRRVLISRVALDRILIEGVQPAKAAGHK
jgi:excisionase family DNA binding protein